MNNEVKIEENMTEPRKKKKNLEKIYQLHVE